MLPHLKDGKPGVHPIFWITLLEGRKVGHVDALDAASDSFHIWDWCHGGVTYFGGIAGDSFIDDNPDLAVVFWLIPRRVEILNVSMPRVHDDEDAVLVSAQNKPSSSD